LTICYIRGHEASRIVLPMPRMQSHLACSCAWAGATHDFGPGFERMNAPPDTFRPVLGRALAAGVLLAGQGFAQPASAERLESLSADVGYSHYYDSNLYRVGEGRTGPNGKRHD